MPGVAFAFGLVLGTLGAAFFLSTGRELLLTAHRKRIRELEALVADQTGAIEQQRACIAMQHKAIGNISAMTGFYRDRLLLTVHGGPLS